MTEEDTTVYVALVWDDAGPVWVSVFPKDQYNEAWDAADEFVDDRDHGNGTLRVHVYARDVRV